MDREAIGLPSQQPQLKRLDALHYQMVGFRDEQGVPCRVLQLLRYGARDVGNGLPEAGAAAFGLQQHHRCCQEQSDDCGEEGMGQVLG